MELKNFFLFQKFEIQSELSKKEILRKVYDFADSEYTDYYCRIKDDGFVIAEKCCRKLTFGYLRNSFAPVATAKMTEKNGLSSVKGILRMRIPVMLLTVPFCFISLITIVTFPFTCLLMYFAFVRPANQLKKELEFLLSEAVTDHE